MTTSNYLTAAEIVNRVEKQKAERTRLQELSAAAARAILAEFLADCKTPTLTGNCIAAIIYKTFREGREL